MKWLFVLLMKNTLFIPVAKALLSHLNMTMQNNAATEDLLGLNLTLRVAPVITFNTKAGAAATPGDTGTFHLAADAAIQYTSVSRVLNDYLSGQRFNLSEGLFAKHVVVKNVAVSGTPSHSLILRVAFTGSFNGVLTFTGTPVYNEETETIVLLSPRYDLQTGNLLLQGARLLFAARIEKEMKKATRFPAGPILEQMQNGIDQNLNKEWAAGIRGAGKVKNLRLVQVKALPEHLLLQATCEGSLHIAISELALNFKR